MRRLPIITVCAIIIAILLSGCGPAQAIYIDLGDPKPSASTTASFSDTDPNATPGPSATSDRSAYVDEKEARKAYKPTSTFATADEKDFTTAGNGAAVICNGDFSISLPAGSKYYCLKDNTDITAFLVKYKGTDITIMQTNVKPEDVLAIDQPILPDMRKGEESYNEMKFTFLGYASGKDYYRYDYYFNAYKAYYCISFSAKAGVDMGQEIKALLDSLKLMAP